MKVIKVGNLYAAGDAPDHVLEQSIRDAAAGLIGVGQFVVDTNGRRGQVTTIDLHHAPPFRVLWDDRASSWCRREDISLA